jgi:hypothetical protein
MKIGDMDYEEVLKLFRALVARNVEYVVVGAIALGLHGLIRATTDLDLFVRPTEDNVARLRDALYDVWHDPAISEISAAELAGEIPVIRYSIRPIDARDVFELRERFGLEDA